MSTQATDLTVRKTVSVNTSVEAAFATFTERLGTWWPLKTHAMSDKAETAVFEGETGGRVFERTSDGEECVWGEVLEWEPPHRVVFSWHVSPGAPTTEIEVRFAPAGDGTRVELEHRGWELYGATGAEARSNYDSGWEIVLGHFVKAFQR